MLMYDFITLCLARLLGKRYNEVEAVESRRLKEMQGQYTDKMTTYLPAIRHTLNLTQKQLAEKVGLTRQTIISFENRQRSLPWHTYLALVLYFQQYEISRDFMDRLQLFNPELLTHQFKSNS